MQAVVLTKDFKLEMQQKEIKRPSATQVLVHLSASALNRRDYWITQKLYPRVKVRGGGEGRKWRKREREEEKGDLRSGMKE